jgi:hypothetical protein
MKSHTAIAILGLLGAVAAWPKENKLLDCSNPKKNTLPCYVVQVRKVLKTYRTQIQGHVKKTEAAYDEVGAKAAQGRRDVADGELRYERARRSERFAADFLEGRKAIATWKDLLKEYGDFDWRITRELLEKESTDGSELLTGLASLNLEVAKVDALDTLFSALEKPDNILEQLQLLQKFASETRTEFDKKVCAGLKAELKIAKDKEASLTTKLAALAADSKDRPDVEKALKAAKTEVKALTDRRTEKKCSD